ASRMAGPPYSLRRGAFQWSRGGATGKQTPYRPPTSTGGPADPRCGSRAQGLRQPAQRPSTTFGRGRISLTARVSAVLALPGRPSPDRPLGVHSVTTHRRRTPLFRSGLAGFRLAIFALAVCAATTGLAAVCGNGILEAGEACDDGNTQPNDCCS